MLFHCWLTAFDGWPGIEKALGECPVFGGMYLVGYTPCRSIHPIPVQCWASVAAYCWFNTGQSCTKLAQRYTNTGPSSRHTSTPASTAPTVTKVASMLIQCVIRWPNILYTNFAAQHCCNCYAGDAFIARLKKGHLVTRYIGPIAKYCWATVCDAGPTLKVINLGPQTLYSTCSQ